MIYTIVTLAGHWSSNMYNIGMALWPNTRYEWMCLSFLCLWLMQHFTTESETVLLVLFSRCFWRDFCHLSGSFEFRTQVVLFFFSWWHPFLEENCKFWRSLCRVLPTMLLLHPLKRTVMIQHCWTTIRMLYYYTTRFNNKISSIKYIYSKVMLRIENGNVPLWFCSFPRNTTPSICQKCVTRLDGILQQV